MARIGFIAVPGMPSSDCTGRASVGLSSAGWLGDVAASRFVAMTIESDDDSIVSADHANQGRDRRPLDATSTASGARTTRAAVEAALRLLVQTRTQKEPLLASPRRPAIEAGLDAKTLNSGRGNELNVPSFCARPHCGAKHKKARQRSGSPSRSNCL